VLQLLVTQNFSGDKTLLGYYVRPMRREDVSQVNEIDREAFPTQWPPPNYNRELQNKLAHHIVACDENKMVREPEVKIPPAGSISGLVFRLTRLFRRGRFFGHGLLPAERQYILGFAGIWVLGDEAHITNIAVRNSCQRQGIGERLLIAIIDLAVKLSASVVTLEVRVSNTAAQKLYYKYGFTQVGLRHGYYTDNREDGLVMTTESIASTAFQARLQRLKQAYSTSYGICREESISPR